MKSTKSIALWALYDFGNNIAIMVFVLYFSQWLVVDRRVSDVWYNAIFIGSSSMLLCSAPFTSVIADRRATKVPFWAATTLLQFVCLLATGVLASYFTNTIAVIVLVIIVYTFSNYFHQFSLIFYNSLLTDISTRNNEGLISGFGQLAKWVGTIVGLAIGIPFARSAYAILGNGGRSQTFIPATIISIMLTVPCLFLKGVRSETAVSKTTILEEARGYIQHLKMLLSQPGMRRFFVSFFLFNDALLTVEHNMPIYMERVLGVSDRTKSVMLAATFVAAGAGAVVGGLVSDKIGHKRGLVGILILWAIFLPVLACVRALPVVTVCMVILGLLLGMIWAVSRAVMADLAPSDQTNHAFSYYTLMERFATLVGPLAWGLIATGLVRFGALRYRASLLCMVVFIVAGLVVLLKVPAITERSDFAPGK